MDEIIKSLEECLLRPPPTPSAVVEVVSPVLPSDEAPTHVTDTATLRVTTRSRPFGLQRVFDTYGEELYITLTAKLLTDVRVEVEELQKLVLSGSWMLAHRLTHKLKGTMRSLDLDCAMDVAVLNATLRVVNEGDGAAAAAAPEQCAAFTLSFGDVLGALK